MRTAAHRLFEANSCVLRGLAKGIGHCSPGLWVLQLNSFDSPWVWRREWVKRTASSKAPCKPECQMGVSCTKCTKYLGNLHWVSLRHFWSDSRVGPIAHLCSTGTWPTRCCWPARGTRTWTPASQPGHTSYSVGSSAAGGSAGWPVHQRHAEGWLSGAERARSFKKGRTEISKASNNNSELLWPLHSLSIPKKVTQTAFFWVFTEYSTIECLQREAQKGHNSAPSRGWQTMIMINKHITSLIGGDEGYGETRVSAMGNTGGEEDGAAI